MRIAFATDLYPPMVGGVPTVTVSLASSLARRGHEVSILAPSGGREGVRRSDAGLTEHLLPSVGYPFYPELRLVPSKRVVAATLAAAAPDVVHVQSPLLLGRRASAAARRAGVPVVATFHYLPSNAFPRLRPGGAAERLIAPAFYRYLLSMYDGCALVTAPTHFALGLLERRGLRAAATVVSNGVDLARFAPGPPDDDLRGRMAIPAGQRVILSVSRLSPEKRLDLVVAAVAALPPGPVLVMAGTGPEESRLRTAARRRGVAARFLGHVADEDLPGLYRLADVYVTASPVELQSLATLNALASGVPVVIADEGALPELLTGFAAGRCFRAGDPGALAAAITAVFARDRPSARRAARACALPHDMAGVLDRWEEIYGRVGRSTSG